MPFTPKLVESRESNVEWSMVSNAAQCIFDVFLTKPVGVNENLGG